MGQRVMVRHQAGDVMAEGNHAGAGKRRHIDNRFRLEALNVGQHIAQHQTAFGVGVQHFHRLAGHGGQNIARAIRATARHVFTARQHADHVQRQLQLSNHPHHPVHRRGAAHVVLHLVHAFSRLDGDAAGVEGQASTDQHDRARVFRRVDFILDDRHQRLVLRTVADGEVGVHSQLAHLLFADHAGDNVFAIGIGQLACLGGQIGGVTDVRRHVAEIFRRFDAGGDRQPVLNGAFAAGQLATGRHVKDHFTQRATRLAFVGLKLVEAVQRLFGGFNGLANFPVVVTALDVQLGQEADRLH
ncbi:hypothetical protein SB00610_04913 [Klebsiella quasipneumoniae subsp. similipneumoniae]|nr:hypothetical protein SB00610_04913 [Klebsiella quasipneumoniae subsp. similipneumoniae]